MAITDKKNREHIHVNKTVTRNFIIDMVANIQNFFGMNLTGYEKLVEKAMQQINQEIIDIKFNWFRYQITQLTNGALSITLYGEVNNEIN